jgi:hypothetical protein
MPLETDPGTIASTGVREDRLQAAARMVEEWVAGGVLPGAALLIARGDRVVA